MLFSFVPCSRGKLLSDTCKRRPSNTMVSSRITLKTFPSREGVLIKTFQASRLLKRSDFSRKLFGAIILFSSYGFCLWHTTFSVPPEIEDGRSPGPVRAQTSLYVLGLRRDEWWAVSGWYMIMNRSLVLFGGCSCVTNRSWVYELQLFSFSAPWIPISHLMVKSSSRYLTGQCTT